MASTMECSLIVFLIVVVAIAALVLIGPQLQSAPALPAISWPAAQSAARAGAAPVSYTHLTLPTKRIV